jgi:hypothetical protein
MIQSFLNDHFRRRSLYALCGSRIVLKTFLVNNRISTKYSKRIMSVATTMQINTTGIASLPLVTSHTLPLLSQQNFNHNNNPYYIPKAVLLAASAFVATIMMMIDQQHSKTQCCGIAGVVGSSKNHDARYVCNYNIRLCRIVSTQTFPSCFDDWKFIENF